MAEWCAGIRAECGRKFAETTGRRYRTVWRKVVAQALSDDLPSLTEAYAELRPNSRPMPLLVELGRILFLEAQG
jgi:hypothetical protein